jgi:hypothetical protein
MDWSTPALHAKPRETSTQNRTKTSKAPSELHPSGHPYYISPDLTLIHLFIPLFIYFIIFPMFGFRVILFSKLLYNYIQLK